MMLTHGAHAIALTGQAFDDTWALSFLLKQQTLFDIRLVLSSTRNTLGRATLAAKFLHMTNNSHIPVGVGVETPCQGVSPACVGPQWPWVGDYNLSQYPGPVALDGVSALMRELDNASAMDPLWILSISPMGNLAAALQRSPQASSRARVVSMSGSLFKGYSGTPPPDAEYNVAQNISAAQRVYEAIWSDFPVTGPLDTTQFFQIGGDVYQRFLKGAGLPSNVIASVLLENYQVWYDNGGSSEQALQPFSPTVASSTNYDLQVAAMAACLAGSNPIWFVSLLESNLEVNGTGFTVSNGHASPKYAATEWVGGTVQGTTALGGFVVSVLLNEDHSHCKYKC